MHFYVAPRVANRLDTEIRVLSRKLAEQMTAGLPARRRVPVCWLHSLSPGFGPPGGLIQPSQGKCSEAFSDKASTLPWGDLISLTQSCSHLASVVKPGSLRRKTDSVGKEEGSRPQRPSSHADMSIRPPSSV